MKDIEQLVKLKQTTMLFEFLIEMCQITGRRTSEQPVIYWMFWPGWTTSCLTI